MRVGNPSARSGTPPVRPTLAGDPPLANMLPSLGWSVLQTVKVSVGHCGSLTKVAAAAFRTASSP